MSPQATGGSTLERNSEKRKHSAGLVGADRRAARVRGQLLECSFPIPWARPARRSGPTGKPLLVLCQKRKGKRDKEQLHTTRVFPLFLEIRRKTSAHAPLREGGCRRQATRGSTLERNSEKTQTFGWFGRGRPPGGPCARTASGMFFPNPLGSARPAVGPYRKAAEGATTQKQLPATQVFPLLQPSQMRPPPPAGQYIMACNKKKGAVSFSHVPK